MILAITQMVMTSMVVSKLARPVWSTIPIIIIIQIGQEHLSMVSVSDGEMIMFALVKKNITVTENLNMRIAGLALNVRGLDRRVETTMDRMISILTVKL